MYRNSLFFAQKRLNLSEKTHKNLQKNALKIQNDHDIQNEIRHRPKKRK